MALILFAAGIMLFTTHNDFPFYYHPDEKGKVRQILEHSRNFKHPLMLLTATSVVTRFHSGPPLTAQQVVQEGRAVSAVFAALAVVAMALLARRVAGKMGGPALGVLGGWSAGVFVLMNGNMFYFAHLMKEDPALVMGMAFTFLALHVFETRRDDASVLFVGAAVATAVSGKYVGWLLFPFTIAIVLHGGEPALRKHYTRLFLKSFFLSWALMNYSLIFNPFKPFSSIAGEMEGVVWGHRGYTKDVPHADYVRAFLSLPLAITSLFGVYVAGLAMRRRKLTLTEWFVPGLGLLMTLIMSFSPKSSSRYFLPVEMIVCFGAGLGAVGLAAWLCSRCGKKPAVLWAAWALIFGAALWNVTPDLKEKLWEMTQDDRVDMRNWIASHLPDSAVIVEDERVHLPVPNVEKYASLPKMAQRILETESSADLGTLGHLRAIGVTHVAIDSATSIKYDSVKPTSKTEQRFLRCKAFYASLGILQNTNVQPGVREIWSAAQGTTHLQPGLRLFDITAVPPDQSPSN